MLKLYGLKNCDRCRAARKWLAGQSLGVEFIDLRDEPPLARELQHWVQQLGWQALLNRMSKTWRTLPEAHRQNLDQQAATALMHAHPLLIKRPVLVRNRQIHIGFTPEHYAEVFGLEPS